MEAALARIHGGSLHAFWPWKHRTLYHLIGFKSPASVISTSSLFWTTVEMKFSKTTSAVHLRVVMFSMEVTQSLMIGCMRENTSIILMRMKHSLNASMAMCSRLHAEEKANSA
jgi:hypothetical protein